MSLSLKKVHMPLTRLVIISFFGSFTISFCFGQVLISDLLSTAFDAKCQGSVPLTFLMVSTFLIWVRFKWSGSNEAFICIIKIVRLL